MAQLTNCPGCGRHCDINNLACPRGEQIVKNMQQGNQSQSKNESNTHSYTKQSHDHSRADRIYPFEQKNHNRHGHDHFHHSSKQVELNIPEEDKTLIKLLKNAGKYLHFLEHTGNSEKLEEVFSNLTSQEKVELQELLKKLNIEEPVRIHHGHRGHHRH